MKIVNFQSVRIHDSQLCVAASSFPKLVLIDNLADSRVACETLRLLLSFLLMLLVVEVELFLPDLV
jgi:hypothetical protein